MGNPCRKNFLRLVPAGPTAVPARQGGFLSLIPTSPRRLTPAWGLTQEPRGPGKELDAGLEAAAAQSARVCGAALWGSLASSPKDEAPAPPPTLGPWGVRSHTGRAHPADRPRGLSSHSLHPEEAAGQGGGSPLGLGRRRHSVCPAQHTRLRRRRDPRGLHRRSLCSPSRVFSGLGSGQQALGDAASALPPKTKRPDDCLKMCNLRPSLWVPDTILHEDGPAGPWSL